MQEKTKQFILKIIPIAIAAGFLGGILYVTSVTFVILVLGILLLFGVWIHLIGKRKPFMQLLGLGAAAVIIVLLQLSFVIRNLPTQLPFYQLNGGSFYTGAFLQDGLYPDSLLKLLVKDKQVIVHDAGLPYEHPVYNYINDRGEWETTVDHDPNYYNGRDYYRFFSAFANTVQVDGSLQTVEQLGITVDTTEFIKLGMGNDMMRYAFAMNEDGIQHAGSFWYDYYYTQGHDLFYIYLNPNGMQETAKLIALWDEENNLFVMSDLYYNQITGAKQ